MAISPERGNDMAKYKIIFEGDEQDEVFDTYEEADEYALYLVLAITQGVRYWR